MDRIQVKGGQRLEGRIRVSGSKNSTLPLMAAALLGETTSIIHGVPDLRDIQTMAEVLRSLGARVKLKDGTMTIDPTGFSNTEAPYDMVRKMRASVYVMGPMLARLREARVSLPGGCAIGPRPIDLHLKGFEALGANLGIEHGYIVATCDHLKGDTFSLSGAAGSSVGATCNVLMAATLAEGRTVILGAAMEPDVCELGNFLTAMGARIEGCGTPSITVDGVRSLKGVEHTVVADRIEAGTFMTAAAITHGDVWIDNAPLAHMASTMEKLRDIGVEITEEGNSARICGTNSDFRPITISTSPFPGFPTDMQAQFMALLSVVPGVSTIREGIYTDRFMHVPELNRMGARINVFSGSATIEGVESLSGAPVMASDLRASAALVVAGLAASGTTLINRVYHIDRGYEQIEKKLSGIGANIVRTNEDTTEFPSIEIP